jgi:hypothetical protein
MNQIDKKYLPAWIKAKQNGTLGEARAKSFLLERFWILERSIDIDGVDFIIQRRITNKNILDREPTRFGVVQVKFFESENTTHYIHSEYIIDKDGNSRKDFFVSCHTGYEDNHKMYLLTSDEIVTDFEITLRNNIEQFYIPGKKLLNNKKYEVHNLKNSLDRIENQIICSDFVSNRQFISWNLEGSQIDIDAILPIYKEPIDNWWGDIPSSFKELKETARKASIYVGDINKKLQRISEEIDPMKAFEIIDEIRYECFGGGRWYISLPDEISNEEFEHVCCNHLEIVNQLKEDGLLDNFIECKSILKKEISDYIINNIPIEVNTGHKIRIKFSLTDFTFQEIKHTLIDANTIWQGKEFINEPWHIEVNRDYKLLKVGEGEFECSWVPMNYLKGDNPIKYFKETDFFIYYRCMDFMYNMKYEIETY